MLKRHKSSSSKSLPPSANKPGTNYLSKPDAQKNILIALREGKQLGRNELKKVAPYPNYTELCRELMKRKWIRGEKPGREWFYTITDEGREALAHHFNNPPLNNEENTVRKTVWRLLIKKPEVTLPWMDEHNRIAIGWGEIGDLRQLESKDAISQAIKERNETHPDHIDKSATNIHHGCNSLFDFCFTAKLGDWVILSDTTKRQSVWEVDGEYEYVTSSDAPLNYRHQRQAHQVDMDPDQLWLQVGGKLRDGQVNYRTFGQCANGIIDSTEEPYLPEELGIGRYVEGTIRTIMVNRYERDPKARQKCIEHYGSVCTVCGMDFSKVYGQEAEGFIHVHHLEPLSKIGKEYKVDPINDLLPVCANCHAIIHLGGRCLSIEEVRQRVDPRVLEFWVSLK